MYYIYALLDPRNNLPFYIGKGKNGRKNDHLSRKLHANKYKQHVIEQIRNDGIEPIISVLFENILDEDYAYELETLEIAKYGRRIDGSGILTNLTAGGRGTKRTIRTVEHRKKLGWSKGKTLPESQKLAISNSMKNRKVSDSAKENIRKSRIGKRLSQKSIEKISSSLTGKRQSEETKRKRSETLKKRYQDEELRKRIGILVSNSKRKNSE